jgi:hypothetical protein
VNRGGETGGQMPMRLGALEKSILLACLENRLKSVRFGLNADIRRDQLPEALWDWSQRDGRTVVYLPWQPGMILRKSVPVPPQEYQSKQAALTRALQSLYRKRYIDAGRWFAGELRIYSERRAAALGMVPHAPLTDEELAEIHYPKPWEGRPWSHKGNGEKPRQDRTMKYIRLTDEGFAVVTAIKDKLQKTAADDHSHKTLKVKSQR